MRVLVSVSLVLVALCLITTAAFAFDDGAPENSGLVLWVVPQVHFLDLQATMNFEDKVNSNKHTVDSDLTNTISEGLSAQVAYVTSSSLFVALEGGYHVILEKAEKKDFEDYEAVTLNDDNQVHFRLTQGRVGALAGYYFMKAPFRPYIMVGAGANQEKLSAFNQDFEAMAFNVSGAVGGDFYASKHLAVGIALRGDYMVNESFTKDFTTKGDDHSVTVTINRVPMMLTGKIGYMF
jgi:hypothetical protein